MTKPVQKPDSRRKDSPLVSAARKLLGEFGYKSGMKLTPAQVEDVNKLLEMGPEEIQAERRRRYATDA